LSSERFALLAGWQSYVFDPTGVRIFPNITRGFPGVAYRLINQLLNYYFALASLDLC